MKKMSRENKQELVKNLTGEFSASTVNILANFSALSVAEMQKLRSAVRKQGGRLKVVKNTLLEKTFAAMKYDGIAEMLRQPVFVAWTRAKDEIGIVKTLLTFGRETGKVKLKAGIVGGAVVDGQRLEQIGRLPDRKSIEAAVVMNLRAPLTRVVNSLRWPAGKLTRVIKQIQAKQETQQASG